MGYRCYIKGQTAENKIKDQLCLGKCYGYNEDEDGLMLGYTFIMNTPQYKEQRKEWDFSCYTDYEIIDTIFVAQGSVDMHLLTEDFIIFLDLYLLDYKKVWKRECQLDDVLTINDYLKDCISVFVEWW